MGNRPSPISQCPGCGGRLKISRLACPDCGLAVEGDFATSRLGLLSPEQQDFAEVFLAARGNIREVEQHLGISYPTVRKRLDGVVAALGREAIDRAHGVNRRNEILSRIEKGDLSAKEGARLLREL